MSYKIPLSIFVIGVIAVAAFSFYLPYIVDDYNWDELNTPQSVEDVKDADHGDINVIIEPNTEIGDNSES
jgi:hypothetical protein